MKYDDFIWIKCTHLFLLVLSKKYKWIVMCKVCILNTHTVETDHVPKKYVIVHLLYRCINHDHFRACFRGFVNEYEVERSTINHV